MLHAIQSLTTLEAPFFDYKQTESHLDKKFKLASLTLFLIYKLLGELIECNADNAGHAGVLRTRITTNKQGLETGNAYM